MAMSFNERTTLSECQLKQDLYLHACFDLLSCATTIVCAAAFKNRYGKKVGLIENKSEYAVIPDLFSLTTAECCLSKKYFVGRGLK